MSNLKDTSEISCPLRRFLAESSENWMLTHPKPSEYPEYKLYLILTPPISPGSLSNKELAAIFWFDLKS
jgi:hypothetical protein